MDQISEDEIQKLYGEKWRKSALIEEAYEAEVFFPRLGENGKWCWFTAAPIKGQDGSIVGAIETLWDKTEDKKAEEERELPYQGAKYALHHIQRFECPRRSGIPNQPGR